MTPIIVQPGVPAQAHPDEAARNRADRLATATASQAQAALAFLSVIDPVAFEIAMDAADLAAAPGDSAPGQQAPEDEEAIPVCARCSGLIGIFLDRGLEWQHFRGDATTSGAQEIYDPGHPAEVTWTLPGENPEHL